METDWRRHPDQVYLDFLGATEEELLTHSGNIDAGREAGLMPLYSCASDENDWDVYEEAYHANVVRYFDSHPMDPDRAAMLEWIASWNRHYRLYGERRLGSRYIYLKSRSRFPFGESAETTIDGTVFGYEERALITHHSLPCHDPDHPLTGHSSNVG